MSTSEAGAGPEWRSSARRYDRTRYRPERGRRKLYTGPLLVALFATIEGLLALRILGQATSTDPSSFPFRPVVALTNLLVAPFRNLRPEYTAKETGIIEFSSLMAFEVYLVAGLALIFLIQVTRITAWYVTRKRRALAQAALAAELQGTPEPEAAEAASARPAVNRTPGTRAA